MWKKSNNQWTPVVGTYPTTTFIEQLVPSSVFQTNSTDAVIYTAAFTLNDIFQNFRLYCNSSDASNDTNGFWIIGWFDPNEVVKNVFNNLHTVNYASTNTYTFTSPITRASIDNIQLYSGSPPSPVSYPTLIIDGSAVFDGQTVLLTNQGYETLTTYSFTSTGNTVTIIDTDPATVYQYFGDGDEIVFLDAHNNPTYDTVSNLRTSVVYNDPAPGQHTNYVLFETTNTIPTAAIVVGDRISGNWVLTDNYVENGIYLYQFGNLTRTTDLNVPDNYIVWVTDGITNTDTQYYLTRKANGAYPTVGTDKIIFATGTAYIVGHNISYNLSSTNPSYSGSPAHPYCVLVMEYDLANKLHTIDADGRVATAYKDSNDRVYAVPITYSDFSGLDTNSYSISFATSYAGNNNALYTEIVNRYSGAAHQPSTTFTSIKSSPPNIAEKVVTLTNCKTFTSGQYYQYTSSNATWNLFTTTTVNNNAQLAAAAIPNNYIYVGTHFGASPPTYTPGQVYQYVNNVWTLITITGVNNSTQLAAAQTNLNHIVIGTTFTNNNVFSSTNGGANNYLQLGLSVLSFDPSDGDLIRVVVQSQNASGVTLLDHVFVCQNYTNASPALNDLTIYPALSSEFYTDMSQYLLGSGYYVTVTDLSLYMDINDLVSSFNETFLSKYYSMTITGVSSTNLVVSFSAADSAKYPYLETMVTYNVGGSQNLLYPTPLIYGPHYSLYNLLNAANSVFNSGYTFSLPSHTFTYHNVVGASRFGFVESTIIIGSAFTNDYKLHTWVYISYTNVSPSLVVTNLPVFIVNIINVNSETHILVNYNFYLATANLPEDSVTVTVNSATTLSQISGLIGNDLIGNDQTGHDAYVELMLQDNNFRSDITGIIWKGDDMVTKVALSQVTSDVATDDPRLTFVPNEIIRLGSDGGTSTPQLLQTGDWYAETNGAVVISPVSAISARIRFIDGLTEYNIVNNINGQGIYSWILAPGVLTVNAVVGRVINSTLATNQSTLIWYTGEWRNGTWLNTNGQQSIWYSGTWDNGVWTNGIWNSYYVIDNGSTMDVVTSDSKPQYSQWLGGTWQNGTWNNGIWSTGSWLNGTWNNGIWAIGTWHNGNWNNGIWGAGSWLNGHWSGGDFQTGTWTNGIWDTSATALARFGTGSGVPGQTKWLGGSWNGGEFHSGLNIINNLTYPSLNHNYTLWLGGIWNDGTWWGGTFVWGHWQTGMWEDGVMLGGYKITSITDVSATVKTLTLAITEYDSMLGITTTAHNYQIQDNIVLIGQSVPTAVTAVTIANEVAEQDGVIPYFTITAITATTVTITIPSPGGALSTVTWVAESTGSLIPSGGPYIGVVWMGGTWVNGTWMNGVWVGGTFQAGLWSKGLYLGGTIGTSNDTFVATP